MTRPRSLRFVVRPCDNGEDFAKANGRARQRSWTVYDRETDRELADYDTRAQAYVEAKRLNTDPKAIGEYAGAS
jgi:hypothetical protein